MIEACKSEQGGQPGGGRWSTLTVVVIAMVALGATTAGAATAKAKDKPKAKNKPKAGAAEAAPAARAQPSDGAGTESKVATPARSPVALITELTAQVDKEASKQRPLAELHKVLAALIGQHMDYEEMSRRALGGETWEGRSAADRKQFIALLGKMVERSYVKRFKPGKKVEVRIDDKIRVGKQARVRVKTVVRVESTRADVAYSLRLVDDRWRIYDIVVDEASQLSAYRKSFRKIVQEEGWDGLIRRMNKSAAD